MSSWKFFWRLLQVLVLFWVMTRAVGLVVSMILFVMSAVFAAIAITVHFVKKRS